MPHSTARTTLLLGFLAIAFAGPAAAAPLTGGFSKSGSLVPISATNKQLTNFTNATRLDFLPLVSPPIRTPGVPGQFRVNQANDDFAFLLGQVGTIRDFTFSGTGTVAYPAPPVTSFEIVGGLFFDLETVNVVFQNAGFLILEGTGLFRLAGFDDTPGIFRFTSQTSGAGTFSFSASQAAVPVDVPEPALLALLGVGFFGVAATARRRKAKE